MASANPNITEIIATTIRNRQRELADDFTNNNALWATLKKNGGIKMVSGGYSILEEFSYAANTNATWYQGLDILPTAQQEGISGAEFDPKQMSCAVVVSGREEQMNAGKEQMIDLIDARINIAKGSLVNLGSGGLYSDGTGFGGKQIVGLGAGVVASPSTGTYGGIDRANFPFWRNYASGSLGAADKTTIVGYMNTAYNSVTRGADHPNLILAGNSVYGAYEATLQNLQRIVDDKVADMGFENYKYKGAAVVLDGGIGGNCPANVMYMLNTKYWRLRVYSGRNMVPLAPNRNPVNQDGYVKLIGWMGAVTCSGAQFQAYLQFS